MSTSPAPPTPVIRQVALVAWLLALLLPLLLWLLPARPVEERHEPRSAQQALDALVQAIRLAPSPPRGEIQVKDLSPLGPACARVGPHENMPILEDLAEQANRLDRLLARQQARTGRADGPLRQHYQLDLQAWMQPIQEGRVPCGVAAQALRRLAGPSGEATLRQARWSEHQRGAAASGLQPGQPALALPPRLLAQSDPWQGWPGCVLLGLGGGETAHYLATGAQARWARALCEQPELLPAGSTQWQAAVPNPGQDASAWVVPPDLSTLLAPLNELTQPAGRLYANYTAHLPQGHNRRSVGRNEADVGFHVRLTIDPPWQSRAQRMVSCYTGRLDICRELGLEPSQLAAAGPSGTPGAPAMWEQAGARMAAVAIIDVASGRIEALAGAHTPCYAQDHGSHHRAETCPPLWPRPRPRPDELLNHAVFTDAQPGSTVKPIMASVFLEDLRGPQASTVSAWLALSDTREFNTELFCLGLTRSRASVACDRPARVQQRAMDLGWNADCGDQPGPWCAASDLLFGRQLSARRPEPGAEAEGTGPAPLQRAALMGRMFAEPAPGGTGHRLMSLPNLPSAAEQCKQAGWDPQSCESGAIKTLVNEAAGQGQARATALGVATMMARLTAAANGQRALRRPYLVEALLDAQGQPVQTAATREGDNNPARAEAAALPVRPEVARQVLAALAQGTAVVPGGQGTSRTICRHVFGPRCEAASQRFAGKTGTPSFPLDELRYDQIAERCSRRADDDCHQRPVKWYVAAFRSSPNPDAPYDKVLAVLSERNWYRPARALAGIKAGHLHGGSGQDSNNISTEIGMRLLAQLPGMPP